MKPTDELLKEVADLYDDMAHAGRFDIADFDSGVLEIGKRYPHDTEKVWSEWLIALGRKVDKERLEKSDGQLSLTSGDIVLKLGDGVRVQQQDATPEDIRQYLEMLAKQNEAQNRRYREKRDHFTRILRMKIEHPDMSFEDIIRMVYGKDSKSA